MKNKNFLRGPAMVFTAQLLKIVSGELEIRQRFTAFIQQKTKEKYSREEIQKLSLRGAITSDPIFSGLVSRSEGSDYKAIYEFIEAQERLTPLAEAALIPALLVNATICTNADFEGDDSLRALRTMDQLHAGEDLVELLKLCIEKGASCSSDMLPIALRLSFVASQLLEKSGVDLSQPLSPKEANLFHVAALADGFSEAVFDLAFRLGANPNLKTKEVEEGDWDNTALQDCFANEAWGDSFSLFKAAKAHKAVLDLTVQDKEGKNATLLLAKMNQGHFLETINQWNTENPDLLKLDFKAVDKQGRSGLHYACLYKNSKMIQFFVSHGLDLNQADNSGKTPIDLLFTQVYRTARDRLTPS